MENKTIRYRINEESVPVMMLKVEGSTRVAAVGNTTKGSVNDPNLASLIVKFHRGGTYLYKDVTVNLIRGLNDAVSAGTYFAQYIKPKYGFIKIFEAEQQ